jgi:hypothetical protein
MCSSVNQIKPEPPWSTEAHLERVYRRGRQLRRRRQVGVSTAALVAVVGLAVMVGGTTSTVLHPLRTLAGIDSGGSNNGDATSGDVTTTTSADSALAKGHRTTTTEDGVTTTRVPRPTTTVAGATTSVPSGGGGGNTPPPTSPIGACKSTDLVYTTRTNKGSYRPNEQVGIELLVRNASNRPCRAPGPCGVGPWASIENTAGATIWKNAPKAVGCTNPPPESPLLNPSDSHNYGTVASWNQLICPDGDGCEGAHAQPGTYRAIAHRGAVTASGITFALRSS